MSRIRLSCDMRFLGLIEPISTGQVRVVMALSDFVVGPNFAGLCLGLLVVAMKGIASIDPVVVKVCPDQLNYGTQPKGAVIVRRED
jgi:hypothetical protein